MLSITTRLVGLLGCAMLFLVTGVSPIFSSTSSAFDQFAEGRVLMVEPSAPGPRQMKNCEPAECGSAARHGDHAAIVRYDR